VQQIADWSIIPKCLAYMYVAIDIPWTEDETSAELKGIFAELLLARAGGFRAFAIGGIIAPKEMKDVGLVQLRSSISLPLFVNQ